MTQKKDDFTLKTLDRRDPKKVAAFRSLVHTMQLNGMNVWEARMQARKLLNMPVPDPRGLSKILDNNE